MKPRTIHEAWLEDQWKEEYQRVLPMLTKAYESASSEEQERLQSLDERFHAGDREPFVLWVQNVVPGSFSSFKDFVPPQLHLPSSPGSEAIDPLPDWWPNEPVYHGSRAAHRILLVNGLCAPQASFASGDEYGWEEVWRDEVWNSYKSLTGVERRAFRDRSGLSGRRPSKEDIGRVVSLFWVTKTYRAAASHGDVLSVNLSALRYYWWFPDEVLGESSYVFVLPLDCPQALPEAFLIVQ